MMLLARERKKDNNYTSQIKCATTHLQRCGGYKGRIVGDFPELAIANTGNGRMTIEFQGHLNRGQRFNRQAIGWTGRITDLVTKNG